MKASALTIRLLVLAALVALWAPLVPLVLRAFAGSWRFPDLWPRTFSTRGWHTLLAPGSEVLGGLWLSTVIGGLVMVLSCAVAWPAGRVIGLRRFRGRRVVQIALLLPVLVPAFAAALGLQIVFVRLGLAGSVIGVVLVQLIPAVPYATSILAAGFANLDTDFERQAQVLGASGWHRLTRVTLPLMRAPLTAAALLAFLISWSDYVLTLLIGGGRVQTLPVQLFAAVGSTDATFAAAVALVIIAPALLIVTGAGGVLAAGSRTGVGWRQ